MTLDVLPGEVAALGDRAAVVGAEDPSAARGIANVLTDVAGVSEAVVGMRSVVVLTDVAVSEDLLESLRTSISTTRAPSPPGRQIVVPARFDGPDMDEVAGSLEMTRRELVTLLCSCELMVAFLGFSPGFPYLVGLPEPLAGIDRRATPRTSVPAGSIAVAGGFAGIYPTSSPGGWRLLGTTGLSIFDPDTPPYATLRPGDRVRFEETQTTRDVGNPPSRRSPHGLRPDGVEVVAAGTLALVQGAARAGYAGIGVPPAGPADRRTMALANRLVGNRDTAGAVELTGRGTRLRVRGGRYFAHVGTSPGAARWTVDGREMPPDAVVEILPGQTIETGAPGRGVRAYLAAAGGFEPDAVLGSVSTDLLSGLGPGPLKQGDVIPIGEPGRPRGRLLRTGTEFPDQPLRVIPGPHLRDDHLLERLCGRDWQVGNDSSRVGIRLLPDGDPFPATADSDPDQVASLGMVTGAIQLPPDGRPVVLGVDHGSVGGYPVVACVIDADIDRLGQIAPGDSVRFAIVDLDEAARAASARSESIDSAITGWYPTRAGT